MAVLNVIGGGLAGSEAAWQAAERGISVRLYEMRPKRGTGAHVSSDLAELVCSNSLGSNLYDRAPGLLKNELRMLKSLLIECADNTSIPAGGALAVDRGEFSRLVTQKIVEHSNIRVIRDEKTKIPKAPTIIASGPLTSPKLSDSIKKITGADHLYFFDAISPIVTLDSIDMGIAFRASRYNRGSNSEGDYINCPMNETEYYQFIEELINGDRIKLKSFEQDLNNGVRKSIHKFFEACLPIEIMAMRGKDSLAYGPMRPVGLRDPRTGKRPAAVVQLRQDNQVGALYNIVGFQTNLKYGEQRRIFQMIPGLENADFVRFGQMHRNTFINAPNLLETTLQFQRKEDLFFAGQITGVEGYAGNIATGLVAGLNASLFLHGKKPVIFPETTMTGALCHYISKASPLNFQPMKANFGILPALNRGGNKKKRERAKMYALRASEDLEKFIYIIDKL